MPLVAVQAPLDDKYVERTIELPAAVFNAKVNIPLMHQVVVAQLATARQGTASTKDRGEVSGGGRKPYRQKGTGRARQGSTRAPQFTGGGVVHGPKPRNHAKKSLKKMKVGALCSALTARAYEKNIVIVEALLDGEVPSTRDAVQALRSVVDGNPSRLVVIDKQADVATWKSLRNVADVHVIDVGQLNVYDVVNNDKLVFTVDALESFLGPESPYGRRVATAEARAAKEQASAARAKDSGDVDAPGEHVLDTHGEDDPDIGGDESDDASEQMVGYADFEAFVRNDLLSGVAAAILGSPTLETGHDVEALDLQGIAQTVMTSDSGIKVYRDDDPDVDGTAYETDDVDVVTIERHRDFVLVSWPSSLDAAHATDLLQTIASDSSTSGLKRPVTLTYDLGGKRTVVRGAGNIAALDTADLDTAGRIALEVSGAESLAWRLPIEGEERDARFVTTTAALPYEQWRSILANTAATPVVELVERLFGEWEVSAILPLGRSVA